MLVKEPLDHPTFGLETVAQVVVADEPDGPLPEALQAEFGEHGEERHLRPNSVKKPLPCDDRRELGPGDVL